MVAVSRDLAAKFLAAYFHALTACAVFAFVAAIVLGLF
jgi:hypothetical protein